MSNYEEQRLQRIEENKAKLEALGLSHTTYSLKVSIQNTKTNKEKKRDEEHGEKYRPKEVEEFQDSSKEDERQQKKRYIMRILTYEMFVFSLIAPTIYII